MRRTEIIEVFVALSKCVGSFLFMFLIALHLRDNNHTPSTFRH